MKKVVIVTPGMGECSGDSANLTYGMLADLILRVLESENNVRQEKGLPLYDGFKAPNLDSALEILGTEEGGKLLFITGKMVEEAEKAADAHSNIQVFLYTGANTPVKALQNNRGVTLIRKEAGAGINGIRKVTQHF